MEREIDLRKINMGLCSGLLSLGPVSFLGLHPGTSYSPSLKCYKHEAGKDGSVVKGLPHKPEDQSLCPHNTQNARPVSSLTYSSSLRRQRWDPQSDLTTMARRIVCSERWRLTPDTS